MEKKQKNKVLVVDDEPTMIDLVRYALTRNGYEVVTAQTGQAAIEAFEEDFSAVLIDLRLPDTNGLALAEKLRQISKDTQIVMISAHGEIRDAVQAIRQGALNYITKPFHLDDLVNQINQAVSLTATLRSANQLRQSVTSSRPIAGFLGISPQIKALLRQVDRLATLPSTILITGESGTGKSLLARTIHYASQRSKGPFISVSCPSLPSELIESEMFGHERGAFTGAQQRRIGRVEMAEGGSLFLDEVGDLPLNLQPKLLTFLQDRTFFRLGGTQQVQADVRVIAATNVDLEDRVRSREFRQDLYFRLNVIPLRLPPLRERPEDILFLAERYLARLAGDHPPKVLTPETSAILKAYPWPGNVRELENVLERASAFASEDFLQPDDLPLDLQQRTIQAASPASATSTAGFGGIPLEELERRAIVETLRQCDDNKAAAARILGIAEKSIYNKMLRHGLRNSQSPDPSAAPTGSDFDPSGV
jgi:DNA-binding NtrC family response regulator